ncbi:hypothetical protein OPT61_g3182 [Boeremia exigua]|uniref:Uncharacterized protein n=1 Tax=Boeremia exigua TaxID=749465 RepID=A0ACC2IIV7_9PLEO|nr:hypothetical protein OPT61_g3182 [Boeremia exigua]
MNAAPRLACQQCKQRKLRCDKGSPCTACRTAGLACQVVQRARLPRGKSAKNRKQRQSLDGRIKQLEALLEQHNIIHTPHLSCAHRPGPAPNGSQFLAPEFWSSLSESVAGLRGILEDSGNESDEHEVEQERHLDQVESTTSEDVPVLLPVSKRPGYRPPILSPATSVLLFELFRGRVDTVYKVVHLPTILVSLQTARSNGKLTVSNLALEYAIYWMALCTLTDDEAWVMGLGHRIDLLKSYRAAVEHFLASSHLMDHPDLTSLQALIIYMIGLRTCLNSATTWTVVAVAARVATALRLGDEEPRRFSTFDLDSRRRALYAIGILDTHAALDRGTIPVMPASAFRAAPLDINDSDLTPEHGANVPSPLGITDMTHSIMTYKAMICQRKMYELSQDGISSWSERLQLVAGFGAYVDGLEEQIGNSLVPIHMLIVASGHKIHRSLQLLLRRPPYRQSSNAVPLWDTLDVMLAATEVLELHLLSCEELTPWAWKNWVQWHALAVVLAELLTRPSGPLADRAFKVASTSFCYYESIVADSRSGMLWKPIAKLMRRTQTAVRDAAACQAYTAPQTIAPDVSIVDCRVVDDSMLHDSATGTFSEPASKFCIDDEVNGLSLEHEQTPWLAWDAFLEDIIDTSAWG